MVDEALEQCGIPPEGNYIGFGLRYWKGFDDVIDEVVAAAEYAYTAHGLTPLFVPIEYPSDLMPAEILGGKLKCPHYMVTKRQSIETTIGILARMKAVIGIRLHSLMFSAAAGVPVIGMSYDIKVDGFLKYIGSRTCIQLRDVTRDKLIPADRRMRVRRARRRGAPDRRNAARTRTSEPRGRPRTAGPGFPP